MRKFIAIFAAALFCLSQIASAVPAKRGLIIYTQPDGSKISVRVHGDEWFHYVTDEAGKIMEENADGYLVASSATVSEMKAKMAKAQEAKKRVLEIRQEAIAKAQATGSPKIPVVLVEFSDKSFSISNPKTAFENLLMQSGYSANGGTGSVLDYYEDQSRGTYSPQFVVMDVVTLSGKMSTYGSTDTNAAKALYEACQKLDSSVDFSQFDNDGDGKIDMALMYYAGYNEAEGGSSSTIWPHQYYVPYVVTNAQSFDGVKLNRYFCTSELKGTSGTNMCGIGTTCHEFAHSIGLPDFYDTDYETNGECGATYDYDLMCSGPYNNSGCTPPWMNAEELVMLGWMDSITELTTVGSVTVPSISANNPVAYKTPATTDGEYFLYECRPGTGWDAPLSAGLLIYHVDKSTAHKISWSDDDGTNSATAYNLWANWSYYNAINVLGTHPCFYIVPSGGQTSLYYSGKNFTYPGSANVSTYSPIDWAGSDTGFTLSSIKYDSTTQTATFNLSNSNECGVTGSVFDSDGIPISGATVTVKATSVSSSPAYFAGAMKTMSVVKAASSVATAVTDASGAYTITVDNPGTYVVSASKDGYVTKSSTIEVSRLVNQNFYLLREGEEAPSELYTYADDATWYAFGFGENPLSVQCANYYPSTMLSPYSGKQIKSISFTVNGESDDDGKTTTTGDVYVLIDYGAERKAFVKVENPSVSEWNTVDLTDQELIIPDGTDIYAGYALDNWAEDHPMIASAVTDDEKLGYYADYDTTSATWNEIQDSDSNKYVFMVKLNIGDYTAPETGYNYIDNPKGGVYSVGDTFALSLVETASDLRPNTSGVSWYYDDEPVSSSVRLGSAGTHTISAEFVTVSGDRKVIDLEIEVN